MLKILAKSQLACSYKVSSYKEKCVHLKTLFMKSFLFGVNNTNKASLPRFLVSSNHLQINSNGSRMYKQVSRSKD